VPPAGGAFGLAAVEPGRAVVLRDEVVIMDPCECNRLMGGENMQLRISWGLMISIFLVSMGLLLDAPARGQSASCSISAGMERTFIFVRELDQDGNPLGELGSGWIDQGNQMPVTSRTGKIAISYQLSSSDKRFETDPKDCSNGTVISVP
jgi:hypothetical protein